ncbi:hypothetical protein HUJ04_004100 [Dendroctonus ponderosae]|nr:hypothetical protein HUJ04_004100 [Dendroctonus ponderosae]
MNKCLSSIICIKNSVIGSNRQKESVIAQGIVPRLIHLLKDNTMKSCVRIEAALTIGSLAKGTDEHVELLINSGIVQTVLEALDEFDPMLVDACICCLRTLASQEHYSIHSKFSVKDMQKLLSLTSPIASLQRRSCIATILTSACKTVTEQNNLCFIGGPAALGFLLSLDTPSIRIPVATCLASMCLNNPHVAKEIVNTSYRDVKIVDYLSLMICRDKPVEMQLEAARCLTNLHRAGAILALDPMITYKTLPCLVRHCQVEHSIAQRAMAAETLAYLTEVDSNLQQIAAISNHLPSALLDLITCGSVAAKIAAFRAFASLAADEEDIRKRIISTKCLMVQVAEALNDQNKDVNLAAMRCLHSLSRSVQQLRTTFQDHSVWKPLMTVLAGDTTKEMILAASSTLCNLLLEFSPVKEPLMQQGAIQVMSNLTTYSDPAVRLNGVWGLMNLTFQAEQRVKSQILNTLGTDQIFRLLADSDVGVIMKTLGLLRNLVSPRTHTDAMMALHGTQVMQAVVLVLEGPHSPEESAVFCIGNLSRIGEPGALERQLKLREFGAVNILQQLMGTSDTLSFNRQRFAYSPTNRTEIVGIAGTDALRVKGMPASPYANAHIRVHFLAVRKRFLAKIAKTAQKHADSKLLTLLCNRVSHKVWAPSGSRCSAPRMHKATASSTKSLEMSSSKGSVHSPDCSNSKAVA